MCLDTLNNVFFVALVFELFWKFIPLLCLLPCHLVYTKHTLTSMSILNKCWKKYIPASSTLYEYLQQQYIFKSGSGPAIFSIIEINTHHKVEVAQWAFPSFYRSYLGQLMYRQALLIKMWELHKNTSITSPSNFPIILKHLHHVLYWSCCWNLPHWGIWRYHNGHMGSENPLRMAYSWVKCGHGNDVSVW